MKKRIYVIACMCIIMICAALGIGYKVYSKDELTEITFNDKDITSQNYCLCDMYITSNNQNSLGLYYEKDTNSDFKLYSFKKEKKDEYDSPKEIELPDNMMCSNMSISPDESKIYMTVISKKNDDENYKMQIAYTDFKDLIDFKIDDLKFIDEINTNDNDRYRVASVDKNEDILFIDYGKDESNLKCAALKGDTYDITNIGNDSLSQCHGVALSPDGQTILITLPYDGNNPSTGNIFVMKKDNDSWGDLELLNTINDGNNDKVMVKISGDNKDLYFIDQTSFMLSNYDNKDMTTKIFKTDFNRVMNNFNNKKDTEAIDKKAEEKSRTYDTANFDTKMRNKGDMQSKKGIYYEIFVRAFADSDGDGIGDINGVTQKLDYLKNLGVDGIWLMPINASPSYHGYDVLDYYSINKDYGTMDDFKNLLNEAHKRNIKVIMDLVVNHTSFVNPWFTKSCIDKECMYRDYYRWVSKDDTENMNKEDKSAWGSDVWTKDGDSYYYSIFDRSMPDLNYNNKEVRDEVKNIAKTYLDIGVDGFRLDGAMHIYGDHEFREQEDDNLKNNIDWWNDFASYCEDINPNVYIVGEVWHDDDVLPEYAKPFDTKFNFTFRNSMIKCINKGSAVADNNKNLSDEFKDIAKEITDSDKNYIDGIFADNHDLNRTINVVQTEEKAKLVANIYLTLPGNPFIYYGEEIGMTGSGNDDEFKRLPFKWNDDKTAPTTNWLEKMTGEKYMLNNSTVSLEKQREDANSIYNHYKKIIAVRKNNSAFQNGTYESINCNNDSIMAYKMSDDKEDVYVIHNLSDSGQSIQVPEVANGAVQFTSNENTNMSEGNIVLDKTSSIIITLQK